MAERPRIGEAAARRRQDDERRLAAALRENLLKRKRQSRARADGADDSPPVPASPRIQD